MIVKISMPEDMKQYKATLERVFKLVFTEERLDFGGRLVFEEHERVEKGMEDPKGFFSSPGKYSPSFFAFMETFPEETLRKKMKKWSKGLRALSLTNDAQVQSLIDFYGSFRSRLNKEMDLPEKEGAIYKSWMRVIRFYQGSNPEHVVYKNFGIIKDLVNKEDRRTYIRDTIEGSGGTRNDFRQAVMATIQENVKNLEVEFWKFFKLVKDYHEEHGITEEPQEGMSLLGRMLRLPSRPASTEGLVISFNWINVALYGQVPTKKEVNRAISLIRAEMAAREKKMEKENKKVNDAMQQFETAVRKKIEEQREAGDAPDDDEDKDQPSPSGAIDPAGFDVEDDE